MSELPEVNQRVTADLSGYVDPIEEAAAETQNLADAVEELNGSIGQLDDAAGSAGGSLGELAGSADDAAEASGRARDAIAEAGAAADDATGQVDALAASEDDATVSAQALAEAERRFRDAVYEANPGIDEQTASLLAEAAAMQALGLSAEETASVIGRTEDYQALLDATFGLASGEQLLVGRNGDMSLSFAAADGAALDMSGALNVAAGSGDGAAASLTKAGDSAAAAGSSFSFMGPAIGVAIVAALGPAAALATSIGAIGSAALLVLPDIRELMKDLQPGATGVPKSGPIATAIDEIHQLGTAWRQLGADSGLQGDFLREIPVIGQTIEQFLGDLTPLARAGATSIDEIVSAADRLAQSQGFTSFVDQLARDAPGATAAVLNLAGAVGGDLEAVLSALAPQAAGDTNAIAGLLDQLRGPLGTAAAIAGGALHGLIDAFDGLETGVKGVAGPLSGLEGPLKGLISDAGGLGNVARIAGRDLGDTLLGPLGLAFFVSKTHEAASGAKELGTATTAMGGAMQSAAGETQALITTVAGLTSEFSKALNPQVTLDQAAVTYRDDLATLRTDLASSSNEIGLNTAAQRTSYSAYLAVIQAAEAYAEGEGKVSGGAAGMRSVLAGAIKSLEDTGVAGGAAAKLIDELKTALDDIPRNVYSDVHISVTQTGGQAPISGTTGHQYGVTPSISGTTGSQSNFIPAPSVTPGGGQPQIIVHAPVSLGAGFGNFADPRFLQGIQPVIQEAVLRYAYQNQGTGFGLAGRHL